MWRGIMRCGSLLLLALGMYGQQYAASDDGRIVYFSGRPVTGSIDAGSRLWTWSGGTVWTVIDTPTEPAVSLRGLSSDGQTILVSYGSMESPDKWQILRHGSAAPLYEISRSAQVSMSSNGVWLAVKRSAPKVSITRMVITSAGVTQAGVLDGPMLQDNRFSIADNGTVHFTCDTGSYYCAWDVGRTQITPLPANVPPGGHERYLYFWDDNSNVFVPFDQTLQRFDRVEGKTVALAAQCPKRLVRSRILPSETWYATQAEIGAAAANGQRVLYSCGDKRAVFEVATKISVLVPSGGVFNSGLTRLLSRPSPSTFEWVALDKSVGPLNSRGLLTTAGEPDFTVEWGGQKLPWIRGAYGSSFAQMPGDVVAGAVDTVSISSVARPWLNYSTKTPVAPMEAAAVSPVGNNRWIQFIHEDYRGFVTPTSPVRRGEYLHLPPCQHR